MKRVENNRPAPGSVADGQLWYARFWLALGISLIVLVLYLSLVDPSPAVRSALSKDKLMHCLAYASLMGWFAQIFRHHLARLLFVLGFSIMGTGIEFIQGMLPARQFDQLDMMANLLGVLLAWALSYTWLGGVLVRFERAFLSGPDYSG